MSISVKDLSFSYGERNVLKNISFEVGDGELACLMGPNGVGKTTLFKCMLGHMRKHEGEILVNGKDISEMTPKMLASELAYIPQVKSQNFSFDAIDVVLMGTTHMLSPFANPGKKEIETAQKAMELVGINELGSHSFTKLSGGEQQLVLIARALAQNSKMLLMDEPTSALDYGNQNKVMHIIKKLSRNGYTVIVSTHNPEQALRYADKVLALKDGKLCSCGAPDETINEQMMKSIYGVNVGFAHHEGSRLMYIKE